MKSLVLSLFAVLMTFSSFWSLQTIPSVAAEGSIVISQSTFYTGDFVDKGTEEDGSDELNSDLYTLEGITTKLLPGIANYIAGALAAVAVLFLIYAGYLFLTSEGDMDKAKTAIQSAFYVLLGLLLLMFAYALVFLFLTLLGSP